jgi:hypothetical protein
VDVSLLREELGSPSAEDISDATLLRLLEEESNFYMAAYRAAEILSRKYARMVDKSIGNYRENASQLYKAWKEVSKDMKKKAMLNSSSLPYVTDAVVEPAFKKGMFDDNYS